MSERKNKKQKVELESPVNSNLLSKDKTKSLRKAHDESGPYKHIVLDQLCTDERMRKIHHEVTNNMKADFKETDLFKVFQTGDLATLDGGKESAMPNLFALRKAIYSSEFRQFVQDITGCGELTDRVDCSCNAYAHGCHLLCHDDVIGTRRISYIIYLTDPDDPWTAEDGGALELYPLIDSSIVTTTSETGDGKGTVQTVQQGVPTSLPGGTLLPLYNTMLIFAVQPGRSYHSVQEVFNSEKPRISISGWYHATTPPVGSDKSSLKQIMTLGDDHRVFSQFTGAASAAKNSMLAGALTLSKKELKELSAWINPNYLAPAAMKDINEQFCANSSLQLNDFIRSDVAYKLTSALITTDEAQNAGHGKPQLNYSLGTSDAWQLVGPPHKRRHLAYNPTTSSDDTKKTPQDEVGAMLDAIRQQLFRSAVFAKYLQIVTALEPLGYKDEVRRFRPGLDYTVAHYGVLTKVARLDATLCFVNDDKDLQDKLLGKPSEKSVAKPADTASKKAAKKSEESDNSDEEEEDDDDYELSYEEVWDGGEVGGFECYIEAEEDPENAEAAEVYRGSYNSVNGNTKSEKPEKKSKKGGAEEEEEEDNTTSLLSVSACNNTLNLVMRDEGVMKFIKYVSANAPGSRWDIAVEYEITPPDVGEDSSEGSEGSEEEESGSEEGSEQE